MPDLGRPRKWPDRAKSKARGALENRVVPRGSPGRVEDEGETSPASKWTRRKFASRAPRANSCARSSPLQAQERRVLACLGQVFAGQTVGIKQVDEHLWLAPFMHYDLGYFDDETCRLEPITNSLRPKTVTHVSGINRHPCVRNGPYRSGAPEGIRTSDLCLRRATLYPAELRAPAPDDPIGRRCTNYPIAGRRATR